MRRVTKFLQRILFYLQPVEITKKIIKIILISRDVLLNRITHYPSTVASFENKFSDYIGVKYGLTFCNGTSSIEAALFALGVSKGDEVIVPSCTFHASIDPIVNIGARPIFADVGYGGVIVTADEVKTKITSKTKCVIVVHLFGYVVDMDEILKIIKEHDITLIEDVSHAHGAKCKNGMAGSYGDIGCFSLQGGKAIAAGEGGVAVTNNKNLMARMSMYGHFNRHNNIFSGDDKVYFDTGIGHKMRAHPLGITLANVDLIFNNYLNKKMKKNEIKIKQILKKIKGVNVFESTPDCESGGFFGGIPLMIDSKIQDYEYIVNCFNDFGFNLSQYPFLPHHKMDVYNKKELYPLAHTEELIDNLFLLDRRILLMFTIVEKIKLNMILRRLNENT